MPIHSWAFFRHRLLCVYLAVSASAFFFVWCLCPLRSLSTGAGCVCVWCESLVHGRFRSPCRSSNISTRRLDQRWMYLILGFSELCFQKWRMTALQPCLRSDLSGSQESLTGWSFQQTRNHLCSRVPNILRLYRLSRILPLWVYVESCRQTCVS